MTASSVAAGRVPRWFLTAPGWRQTYVEQTAQQVGNLGGIFGVAEAGNIKRPQHHAVEAAMVLGGCPLPAAFAFRPTASRRIWSPRGRLHGSVEIHIGDVEAYRAGNHRIIEDRNNAVGFANLCEQFAGIATIVEIAADCVRLNVQFAGVSDDLV